MPAGSSRCGRCEKSSLACTISRHQPRTGRPPNRGLPGVSKGSLGVWDYAMTQEIQESPEESETTPSNGTDDGGLSPSNPKHALFSRLPVEDFYILNDVYMFGSSFASDFYQALEYCHHHSPNLLDEIFIALGSSLSWARFGLLTADQVDISSGAASIEKLRNAVINHSHDALAVLMLGQALAAFDSLVTSAGTISILRCSLSLVQPWYTEIAQIKFLDPITIAPIFWDTVWCLLHREVPVIPPVIDRAGVIDRVAGLCPSLLPILYDLCVASSQMKHGSAEETDLTAIEQRIRDWSPDDTGLCLETYSKFEVLLIRTQAMMYRTASLLLVHRLRHPSMREDATATRLANDILDARTNFLDHAGANEKLQNVCFPLFLALLEVPVTLEGLWESSTRLRSRPACVDQLFAFQSYFWEKRKAGFSGSLWDIIDNGPEFVPVP
ncbi:hypothetical protein FE257_009089 [Aspergillus nanangensis]|uniref:Uncharacterized protein n=1 Tax=Aspergillus nanangensis TaxID=2582783 RepID=A0AAD4GYN6_ASPNN|nr:hypothetical protein FE257_009089 [Aspergillus nanangensis]